MIDKRYFNVIRCILICCLSNGITVVNASYVKGSSEENNLIFYIVPEIKSKIVTDKLTSFYKISSNFTLEPVFHGVANFVFLVKHDNKVISVLKYFLTKNFQELKTICSLTEELRKNNFPIPKTDFILPTSNQHGLIAMEYIQGEHHNFQQKEREEVAKWMAKLHLYPRQDAPTRLLIEKEFEWLFEQCKNWKHLAKIKEIYHKIGLSYLANLPRGLTHGDFSSSNILFNENSNVTAILDFDLIGISYLLTDLTRAQIFFGFNEKGELEEDKIIQFVEAYNAYRPIRINELANFYQHLKLMIINTALWVYYNVHIKKETDTKRFQYSKYNNDVNPEMLFCKLLQIQNKTSLDIKL